MKYISAAELRTKSKKLRESLEKGNSTYLMHRSKVIGVVQPYSQGETGAKRATRKGLKRLVKEFSNMKKYSKDERVKLFDEHLKSKYGEDIPRY